MKFGYNIPIFFEDCSNPITLKYVNRDILKNYKVKGSEILKYDGSILKSAKINLLDLESIVNLDISIVLQNDEIHKIKLPINIQLEDGNKSIYDGKFEKDYDNLNLKI